MYSARAEHYDDSWDPHHASKFLRLAYSKPGQWFLDLTCGIGLVTIPAEPAVGLLGYVIGTDITREMLAFAMKKAQQELLENITFLERDKTRLYH